MAYEKSLQTLKIDLKTLRIDNWWALLLLAGIGTKNMLTDFRIKRNVLSRLPNGRSTWPRLRNVGLQIVDPRQQKSSSSTKELVREHKLGSIVILLSLLKMGKRQTERYKQDGN